MYFQNKTFVFSKYMLCIFKIIGAFTFVNQANVYSKDITRFQYELQG